MCVKPSTARKLPCEFLGSTEVAPGVRVMRLRCPGLAEEARPGQFFNLAVPGDAMQLLRLPFTWSGADRSGGEVEFVFRVVGDGTRRLAALPAGVESDLLGPGGNGWAVPEGAGRALLVGGGVGCGSLLPLLGELSGGGVRFSFVEVDTEGDGAMFESRVRASGAAYAYLDASVARGRRPGEGAVEPNLADLPAFVGFDVVCSCGPEPVMAAVAARAREAGVPCQVSMERLMACGFGACTTCLVETVSGRKSACMVGPVFDGEEVIW